MSISPYVCSACHKAMPLAKEGAEADESDRLAQFEANRAQRIAQADAAARKKAIIRYVVEVVVALGVASGAYYFYWRQQQAPEPGTLAAGLVAATPDEVRQLAVDLLQVADNVDERLIKPGEADQRVAKALASGVMQMKARADALVPRLAPLPADQAMGARLAEAAARLERDVRSFEGGHPDISGVGVHFCQKEARAVQDACGPPAGAGP